MKPRTKKLLIPLLVGSLFIQHPLKVLALDHKAKDSGHSAHEEGVIKLSEEQMNASGIVVEPLQLKEIHSKVSAPGEVIFNAYKTASISPLISAQLVKHLAFLGDKVVKGQPVAKLLSVEMAKAQGAVLVAEREWRRTKKLGRKIVSERRYLDARANWELAKARVLSYGMSSSALQAFLKSGDFSRANGNFVLESPINGRVLKESFFSGQQIEPGEEINIITDESVVWVIANVAPQMVRLIEVGNKATVQANGQQLPAKVSQISHLLDESTRTVSVRLSVRNDQDALHPGLFVDTSIELAGEQGKKLALVLPESAVLRGADGDWQVFVEQGETGGFKGEEIDLIARIGGLAVIKGIAPGTPIVVSGAFFVQSELAKSGFHIHNH